MSEKHTWEEFNSSLNYNINIDAYYPKSVIYNNKLYIVWYEYNGTISQIRMKCFDGIEWNEFPILNHDVNKEAYYPNLTVYNDKLYVSWNEKNDSDVAQLILKSYDGSTWGKHINLSYDNTQETYNSNFTVYNNELYIVWCEHDEKKYQIKMKSYDGDIWKEYDDLNYTNQDASCPNLTVYNDKLYIAWKEYDGKYDNKTRIKSYNGNVFGEFPVLNYDNTKSSNSVNLTVCNDKLYVVWHEYNSTQEVRMKSYDENKWSEFEVLHCNTLLGNIFSYTYKGEIYIIWEENNGIIKMKSYNGNEFEDFNSLNYTDNSASWPNLIVYNNKLYIIWRENDVLSKNQIRMKSLYVEIFKYLLQDNKTNNLLSVNNGLKNLGQQTPTEQLFQEQGFDDITLLNSTTFDEIKTMNDEGIVGSGHMYSININANVIKNINIKEGR